MHTTTPAEFRLLMTSAYCSQPAHARGRKERKTSERILSGPPGSLASVLLSLIDPIPDEIDGGSLTVVLAMKIFPPVHDPISSGKGEAKVRAMRRSQCHKRRKRRAVGTAKYQEKNAEMRIVKIVHTYFVLLHCDRKRIVVM